MRAAADVGMTPSDAGDGTLAAERAARIVWDIRPAGADPRPVLAAQARRRGLSEAGIGFAAAALLRWLLGGVPAAIAAGIATMVALLAVLSPLGGLAALERGVRRFAAAVGAAVAWLLMVPLYWLVLTPLGWFLRSRGKLRIRRRPDPRAATYWTALPETPPDARSYERQF